MTLGAQIARLIRDARLARRWTQRRLAEEAGVTVRTVARVETGVTARWATIELLVQTLDIRIEACSADILPGFGDALREERELRGLSITSLARSAGLARETVSRIERGHFVGSAAARALLDALGVDVRVELVW